MKLTKADIAKIQKVGESPKGEVYHILTKGGLNIIAEKSLGGEYTIVSKAGHRAIARHQAGTLKKDIQWDESLFKSEEPPQQVVHESTPDNHYRLASFYAKQAGKYKKLKDSAQDKMSVDNHHHSMMELYSTDAALRHFSMAGLEGKDRSNEFEKHMKLHHELKENEVSPFNESRLEDEWRKKNAGSNKKPKGLLYNWSE